MSDVVRLIDRAPGFAPSGADGLYEWARNWLDGFADGDYGDLRSLVLVVETADGRVACVSQSLGQMDRARLVGLLQSLVHRKLDGEANIEDLRL